MICVASALDERVGDKVQGCWIYYLTPFICHEIDIAKFTYNSEVLTALISLMDYGEGVASITCLMSSCVISGISSYYMRLYLFRAILINMIYVAIDFNWFSLKS